MTARDEVLGRIRSALGDGPSRPAAGAVVRQYRRAGAAAAEEFPAGSRSDLVELLVDRLVDYRASVSRTSPDGVAGVLGRRLAEHGIGSALVPDGFPQQWLADSAVERHSDEALTPAQLDRIDGVLCTCRLAIAETGTIVLDSGPGQGRRAVSLVPDYLLIVLEAGQVVAGVPEAVAQLDPTRPLTWISGPSATSDIELNRVEGVHGPRTLDVILIEDAETPAAEVRDAQAPEAIA
ncbi:MAG: L-lactate dehydrogenase complex protein LldG [Pseudonocardiales bacterium]|jgi:L-lactate dehydrogenase complex protein LldG|nr:L-lactate dehydrogenase complex protein LldG [Pseudonocardiales bacterium]